MSKEELLKYLIAEDEVVYLLNQQDKRIKELEETNRVLSNELTKNSILKQDHIETCCGIPIFEISKMKEENKQLKQQLHDLPKKIVEEIEDCLLDVSNGWWRYFMTDGCEYMLSSDLQGCLNETIDTILKKYGGEDEL